MQAKQPRILGNQRIKRVECFIDLLVFVTTPCEATISGTNTINPDGSGTDSIAFTTSSPETRR
jgi:hypothetical protein